MVWCVETEWCEYVNIPTALSLTHTFVRTIVFNYAHTSLAVAFSWYFRCCFHFWFSLRSSLSHSLVRGVLWVGFCELHRIHVCSVCYLYRGSFEHSELLVFVNVNVSTRFFRIFLLSFVFGRRWKMVDGSSIWSGNGLARSRHRLPQFASQCEFFYKQMCVLCVDVSHRLRRVRINSNALFHFFVRACFFSSLFRHLFLSLQTAFVFFVIFVFLILWLRRCCCCNLNRFRPASIVFFVRELHSHTIQLGKCAFREIMSVCVCGLCVLPTIRFLIVFIFMFAFWMPFSSRCTVLVSHSLDE